ncbi:MAG: HU family DNA-binding protein [Muribaculum sp.]|nr:HU family DNA-binding protein [Muribaculum sp.]
MNNKITFPRLASLLADKSGRSKRFSEDFLRELFSLITERLAVGETVKVKGLGTFRLIRVEPRKSVDVTTGLPMEISGHSKVVFTPSKELAEAVNAPFDAFSAIEIANDVDIDSIVEDDDIIVQDESEDIILTSSLSSGLSLPSSDVVEPSVSLNAATESQDIQFESDDTPIASPNNDDSQNMPEFSIEQPETTYFATDTSQMSGANTNPSDNCRAENTSQCENSGTTWVKTTLICLLSVLVVGILAFLIWSIVVSPDTSDSDNPQLMSQSKDLVVAENESESENLVLKTDVPNVEIIDDSIQDPVPTIPSDPIVYDTIGKARYLTTMAKDHYGNNKFWPYIYEENKDHIGHPDRIRPGTPIVIPKLSKYGVDPSNPDDAEKANKMGVEIYARYGKQL